MIKAVIFDCFGVLTSDGWLPFKDKYFENDREKYDEATRLNALANGNKIPYMDFLSLVSTMADITTAELNEQMHKSVANTPVFSIIAELKKKYKIGFLSNVSGDWLKELFTADQLALFDAMTLSSKIGYVKPDPMSYRSAAKQLGCEPEECVFIDDQKRLVEGAQAVGMRTIHYQSIQQLEDDLAQVLKVTNSDK